MKLNMCLIFGIILFILTWLFSGIFRDDEFYEPQIFGKHRPTFKINFYSPIGMQGISIYDLSTDKQKEEQAFQEFVIEQRQQNNSDPKLWYLPLVLIQMTLTFLSFGLSKALFNSNFKNWQLPMHFLINILITSLGIGFILFHDQIAWTIVLMLIIFATNIITIKFLTRRQEFKQSKS